MSMAKSESFTSLVHNFRRHQTRPETDRRFRDFTERERWGVTGGVKVPEWTSGRRWWSWSVVTRGGDFFLGNT